MITVHTNGMISDLSVGYANFFKNLEIELAAHNIILRRGGYNGCDVYLINNLDYSGNFKEKTILRMDGLGNHTTDMVKARKLCENVDKIIFQSNFAKEYCDVYLDKYDNKANIIYNGVPISDKIRILKNKNIVIGSVIRRWIQERAENFVNFLIGLRYFQRNTGVKIKYYIVGDTSPWILEDIAKNFQDIDIVFIGLLQRKELDKLRLNFDFIVHLPKFGWCDSSCLESLNIGVPILYLVGTGTEELVQNAGAGIKDIRNIREISNKIKYMIDNIEDLSINALARREMFNIKKISQQYAEVIHGVV